MQIYLKALALTMLFTAPAAAQMGTGNIHGAESRGAPLYGSYKASSVDPATGHTPGYNPGGSTIVKVQKPNKKKKRVRQPM